MTNSPPDTANQCVYPGEGQIAAWIDDYFHSVEHRGMRYEAFLAMKACQWQREQDALICEDYPASEGVHLAGFIRAGGPT